MTISSLILVIITIATIITIISITIITAYLVIINTTAISTNPLKIKNQIIIITMCS